MNATINEIERDGMTTLPNGERVPIHSHVVRPTGKIIEQAIKSVAPKTACEVGLAYGMSSLYILDAMSKYGNGHLIGMDIAQHTYWRGGGLYNIQRAGFSDKYTLHDGSSQAILPRLAEKGTRIQFGFIDGWHTFDHTLVDFFYIDQMMDIGGIVILDDVNYPSIQRLAHFIIKNRDYTLVDSFQKSKPINRAAQFLKKIHGKIKPSSEISKSIDIINNSYTVVLQKNANDERLFDHFVPF